MLIPEQAPGARNNEELLPPRLVLVLQAAALSGLTKVAVLLVPHLAVLVVPKAVEQVTDVGPGRI